MPPNQIVLSDPTISRWLKVAGFTYSSTPVARLQPFDLTPGWRQLDPGERVLFGDSLVRSVELFEALFEVTQDPRWSTLAARAAIARDGIRLNRSIEIFRTGTGGTVLEQPGVRIINQHPDRWVSTVRRVPGGEIGLFLPVGSAMGVVELVQDLVTPTLSSSDALLVSVGASEPAVLGLSVISNGQRYEAPIAIASQPVVQALSLLDLKIWGAQAWRPIESSSFILSGGATASVSRLNQDLGPEHPLVAQFVLNALSGEAIVQIPARLSSAPDAITYALDLPVLLRLQDAAGWYWDRLMPVSEGRALLQSSWSDFALSGFQSNSSAAPVAPDSSGLIRLMQFVCGAGVATLRLYFVGPAPDSMPPDQAITRYGIFSYLNLPHQVNIGRVSIEREPTATLLLPHELSAKNNQIVSWRGHPELWSQDPTQPFVQQLWQEAQLDYAQSTGILGPFTPVYDWNAASFHWAIDWADARSGRFQALIAVQAAVAWFNQPDDERLRSIVLNFLNFLRQAWDEVSASEATQFTPLPVMGLDPAIAALYLRLALYANLAGADRALSFSLLLKSLERLLQFADYSFNHTLEPDSAFAVSVTLDAVSDLLRLKPQLSPPLPSELGTINAYSEILVKQLLGQSLPLPEDGHYGFRFEVPTRFNVS